MSKQIDLEKLRARVSGIPDSDGAIGPTWCAPTEVLELLDHIAALEKDAARYRKVAKLKNVWGVLGDAYGLPSEEAGCGNLDESLDAMEASNAKAD